MNFALFLEMHARNAPDSTALVDKRVRLTWAELDRAANEFANMLADLSVVPGDRVATYMTNRAEMVVAFLGTLKLGAVFLPLNARLQAADLKKVLGHSHPAVTFTTADKLMAKDVEGVGDIVVIDPDGEESLFERIAALNPNFFMLGRQVSDVANLVYTSGTTGMPKAAIHTHGMRLAIAGGMADTFKLSVRDAALIVSPLFHIGGLNVLGNALFAGCKMVLLEKWDVPEFLQTLSEERITYMQVVSTMLVDIANAPETLFADFDSAVRFTWGGGHQVDPETILEYERRVGGVFLQGWGRTEGGFTYNPYTPEDPHSRRFDSHGMPNGNTSEISVYDHDAQRLADNGDIGEIVVRGDGVSPGYWDGVRVREETILAGGWHATGDRGYYDEQGHLHFLGRDDHMIKSGGENVYPAEVEAVLLDMPELADAIVLGVPDDRLGQLVAAVVVSAGPDVSAEHIEGVCRRLLAGFKIPRRIVFAPKLPRLANQKVDLAACREMLARPQ